MLDNNYVQQGIPPIYRYDLQSTEHATRWMLLLRAAPLKLRTGFLGHPVYKWRTNGCASSREPGRVHEDTATLFLITSEPAKWNYFVFCCSAKCIPPPLTRTVSRRHFYAMVYTKRLRFHRIKEHGQSCLWLANIVSNIFKTLHARRCFWRDFTGNI